MLCLHIPGFLVAVHRRADAALAGKPVAILGPKQRVVQASDEALAGGVRPGMTDVQARAALAEVLCAGLDETLVRSVFEGLLSRLLELAPRIEAGPPGLVYLDTRGLGRLYGKLERLVEKVLETTHGEGFPLAGAGVARNKLVARLAAFQGPGGVIVSPASERAFLDPLPITALDPPDELREQLFLLGIHTLGQFSRLDASAVANRYGPEGCLLHRRAAGKDDEPFRPWEPVPEWVEEIAIDFPLTEVERLLFLLTLPLEKMLARLAAEGLTCQELKVELGLEAVPAPDARRLALAIPPGAQPPALARIYLDLLRLELERRPTAGPIARVRLQVAAAVPPHAEQDRLFDRRPQRTAAVAAAISKLAARLGEEAVFQAELVDTWRPEGGWRPGKTEGRREKKEERRKKKGEREQPLLFGATVEAPPPGMRLLPSPQPLRADARLRHLTWNDVSTPILSASGPWSLSGEWWAEGYDREYYEVETAAGWRLWIFRDRPTGDWFVQGAIE